MAEPKFNFKPWLDATVKMLAPFAVLAGILFTVFLYAGEQWVRNIAKEEIGLGAGSQAGTTVIEHGNRLTKVETEVVNNQDDIEKTEDEVNELESEFRQFIQKIIDKI